MRPLWSFLFVVVLVSCGLSAVAETGSISGSVIYMTNRQFEGDVSSATVVVASGKTEKRFTTNDTGNFVVDLPTGTWSLVRVFDASGNELQLDPEQAKSFAVRKNQNRRFDVMVRRAKAQ